MTQPIPQAAVVGGSVVAFAGDLPESHREDIYLSTTYAQRATRAAVRDGLSGDWFEYYRNTLKFIGWDVPKPEVLLPDPGDLMGSRALQLISTQLGLAHVDPLRRALTALERNALALNVFESTSLSQDAGCFQMIPCVLKAPNRVEMGLYHRQFKVDRSVSRFLFVDYEELVHDSTEQIAVITFNTLHYAQFRDKVKKSVLSQSLKDLSALEI